MQRIMETNYKKKSQYMSKNPPNLLGLDNLASSPSTPSKNLFTKSRNNAK